MSTSVTNLVTGLPGAGKTLFTITAVKEQAEKENRQVFYHGIKDLKLPWTPLEKPEEWPLVPPGSIVVLDEAQQLYRQRPAGSSVPPWVSALETLRHRGITLWLITQHPMLLDNHVRRLTGRHLHAIRRFGGMSANVHEFNAVREGVDKPGGRKDSILHVFKYPKKNFGLYQSAEVHTVKRSIPKRAVVLLVLPVALGGIGWICYKNFFGSRSGSAAGAGSAGAVDASTGQAASRGTGDGGRPKTAEEYVASYAPRLPGLEYTAPVYDEITKPVRAPVPVACVRMHGECGCYSQQGTRLMVEKAQCETIVARGFFMAFDPDAGKVQSAPAPSPAPVPVAEPVRQVEAVQPAQTYSVVPVAATGRLGSRRLAAIDLAAFDDGDRAAYDPRNSRR